MSFGGGLSIRTVWITLRAINYTQQAFQAISKNIETLQKSEKTMIEQTNAMRAAALKFISAGIMFSVLGLQLSNTMMGLAGSTAQGSAAIAQLSANFEAAKQSIGGAIFNILQSLHVFDALNAVLNSIRSNQVLAYIVGGFLMIVTALVIVVGAILLAKGAFMALDGILTIHNAVAKISKWTTDNLSISLKGLAMAAGLAFASFTVFMIIGQIMGPAAGKIIAAVVAITMALIALGIAMDWVSLGALTPLQAGAVAAGAAMAAGVLAVQSSGPSYAVGTRSVPRTGPAIVHHGEVIFNPATHRPTQVGNDLEGGNQGGVSRTTTIPITIENVNTKANIDDLDEALRKGLKKTMRESR